jgi:diguanylate cyclase (GGDEF)-like protein/PAS domain S-box-containing protein
VAKARIFVVEDEMIVARDLQRTLIRLGYEVTGLAASGEEALARVAAQPPDLVLMDIHLAGEMDGIAAAQQIHLRHSLPVVFLTAHSDEATFQRAQITEPYGYITKPFEERELEIALGIALYRHRVEAKLSQMERWLSTTLRSIGDAVVATDLAGTITLMNQQAETLTGWGLSEARGLPLNEVLRLVHTADHAPVANLVERVLRENMVIELGPNTLLVARDGSERPVDNSAAPIRDGAGSVSGFVIVFRDITARQQAEEQLRYSAVHDPLTGLANRALMLDRLEHAFERARRHPEHHFAVLYLDLDGFKAINDSLGHLVGDQVLIGVARRLEGSLRGEDAVARMGGDEFVILLESIDDLRGAAHVAARIQQNMSGVMHVEGHALQVGISVGIALHGASYAHAADLLRDADAALYRAKAMRKGQLALSGIEQHEDTLRLLELEGELRHAASAGEFRVFYQPIVALDAGPAGGQPGARPPHGLEALLRWRHPQRGLLLPAEFLDLMEETGQLVEVGGWVLGQACRQAAAWQAAAPALPVSVNLSLQQFRQPDLVERVAEALAAAGLAPGGLCLDIPELALAKQDGALDTLVRLRALGVRLHLDDFGRGLTSLSLLHQAPLDALKIGPAAVEAGLAGTTLLLAHALGFQVIAKGIETPAQAGALRALGCQLGQGFLFGAPEEKI